MKRLAFLLALLGGCGGQEGTLTLSIVSSTADDPFLDAASVRITVGDPANGGTVQTTAVTGGMFTVKFGQKPGKDTQPILVEALDAANGVIAYGRTPPISLEPVDSGPWAVWVGRPGRLSPANANFTPVKSDFASVEIDGFGVLYAGGRGADGNAVNTTEVYNVYTQSLIELGVMNTQRAGAVATPVPGVRAAVFGGTGAAGALNTLELFDPYAADYGLWQAVTGGDTVDARSAATINTLSSGSALVSGGLDANGNPLGTAALIALDSTIKVTAPATAMVTARHGHVAAPAKFPDGDGALLFGGLPAGSTAPVAERLFGQSFEQYDDGDLGALPSRTDATVTVLSDGRLLVVGGSDATGPLASAFFVTTSVKPATVTLVADALSIGRAGHSATLVGADVLVCGGVAPDGTVQASCDLLDGTTGARKDTVPMAVARKNHSAKALETGNVVIAGGLGADGNPVPLLEIYTPVR